MLQTSDSNVQSSWFEFKVYRESPESVTPALSRLEAVFTATGMIWPHGWASKPVQAGREDQWRGNTRDGLRLTKGATCFRSIEGADFSTDSINLNAAERTGSVESPR